MHHSYGVISGSHTCRDCVWPVTFVAGFCTTCRGDRVWIVIRFNVTTFLPLRPYLKKCVPVSGTMQKVQQCRLWLHALMQSDCLYWYLSLFFEHYNRSLLCDWVPGYSSVSLRACAGHNAFGLHQPLTRIGLYLWNMLFSCPALNLVLYQVLQVSQLLCKESVCSVVFYEVLANKCL